MINYVKNMNDYGTVIPRKVSATLNKFFNEVEGAAEGCIIRSDWDGYDVMLIIESSDMYGYLSGEYGWDVHTKFYEAFVGTGWHPEMVNGCQVAFYKD